MLIEIVVTAALLALIAGLATQVLIRTLATGRDLQDSERASLAIDHAVAVLRLDVERAGSIKSGKTSLTLGNVVWSVEPDAIVRTAGNQISRFDASTEQPQLAFKDGVVTLKSGQTEWAFAPIVTSGGGSQ